MTHEESQHKSPRFPSGTINYIIDIDGTVCEDIPNEEPDRMPDAEEIPGARERVNSLYEAGHIITFFTARAEEHREVTEQWLQDHGFKYHGIIFGKPRGGNYCYIDDASVEVVPAERIAHGGAEG